MVHHGGVQREDALDTLPETDLAHRNGLAQPSVVPRDYRAFKRLQPLFVPFFDLHMYPNGVSGTKLGMVAGPLIFLPDFVQKRVNHMSFLTSLPTSRASILPVD